MIGLERHGDVWVLRMDAGENRFNLDSVAEIGALLDQVEATDGPCALVTTGTGKFYSNGLDLEWLAGDQTRTDELLGIVERLLGRLISFPAATVAAINGHAFAAGAMFACAHDYSVMRTDRGFWCLPEADIGLPIPPSMYEVLAARLPLTTLHDAVLTGRRYVAADLLDLGVITEVADEESVLARAMEIAAGLATKDRKVLAIHKKLMYRRAVEFCNRRTDA